MRVIEMLGNQRRVAWTGFSVILIGSVCFVVSYFLLPLYVTTLNCFDTCSPAKHPTMWEFSLNAVAHLPYSPVVVAVTVLLCYLPLVGAVLVAACGLGCLLHPARGFVSWSARGLVMGSIALVSIALLGLTFFVFLWIRPQIGYLGMLVGYAVLWAGWRLFLRASRRVASAGSGD